MTQVLSRAITKSPETPGAALNVTRFATMVHHRCESVAETARFPAPQRARSALENHALGTDAAHLDQVGGIANRFLQKRAFLEAGSWRLFNAAFNGRVHDCRIQGPPPR